MNLARPTHLQFAVCIRARCISGWYVGCSLRSDQSMRATHTQTDTDTRAQSTTYARVNQTLIEENGE